MCNLMNPFSLEGKTILVTGASSGIGRSIAIESSKMGAKIILNGRDKGRLEETLSLMRDDSHSIISADISEERDLENLVQTIDKIDGVVLCVGVSGLISLQYASRKKFENMFDTNFFSNVELVRLLLKNKKINREGSILAIA